MQDPEITTDLIEAHGIKPDEYSEILRILNEAAPKYAKVEG